MRFTTAAIAFLGTAMAQTLREIVEAFENDPKGTLDAFHTQIIDGANA